MNRSTLAHVADPLPSPGWARAMPPAPDASVKITESDARLVARDAFFWAWPLVNVMNRRAVNAKIPEPVISGGAPAAPLNRLSMITDYCTRRASRSLPEPGCRLWRRTAGLDWSPVVIQVPDFRDRFWVYQIVD